MRRAKVEDTGTLLKLARMVHFINLPADKDIITDKVMRSRESFLKAAGLGEPGNHASGRNAGKADAAGSAGSPTGSEATDKPAKRKNGEDTAGRAASPA